MAAPREIIDADGIEVSISNPAKVFFPSLGFTKKDLVDYYLAIAPGALRGCRHRPTTLYRWPNGVDAPDDAFYQKRVPIHRPEWLETTKVQYPSGRSAEMLTITDAASLVWAINLGCLDINPWPVRRDDVDHPDELRVDLDPTPGIPHEHVLQVAPVVRDVLREHDLEGFPKTSGKRGMHIYVRIQPRWEFREVRRAALALAREVERRVESIATTAWWKEERHGVFVDYNQNARDRTIASVYSVRPVASATVSYPLRWEDVDGLDPARYTARTVPDLYAREGDPHVEIDTRHGRLDSLLELFQAQGGDEGHLPPHFPKEAGERPRVQPSRRRRSG